MKHSIKLFALAAIALIGVSSCNKEEQTNLPDVVNNITLEKTLNAGDIYNLDLSTYGSVGAISTITAQATNTSGSKLTTSTNQFAGNYSYTANQDINSDNVVLQVIDEQPSSKTDKCEKENDYNGSKNDKCKGRNDYNGPKTEKCKKGNGNNSGKTEKCQQQQRMITNITIKFKIVPITGTSNQ